MKEFTDEELFSKLSKNTGTTPQDAIQFEITKRLKDSVDKFSNTSSRQTRWLIGLTIVLGILALIQIILIV